MWLLLGNGTDPVGSEDVLLQHPLSFQNGFTADGADGICTVVTVVRNLVY